MKESLNTLQFKDPNTFNKFSRSVQSFVSEGISKIGAMTLNERLYWFCLFDEWDKDSSQEQRIRIKLVAPIKRRKAPSHTLAPVNLSDEGLPKSEA